MLNVLAWSENLAEKHLSQNYDIITSHNFLFQMQYVEAVLKRILFFKFYLTVSLNGFSGFCRVNSLVFVSSGFIKTAF